MIAPNSRYATSVVLPGTDINGVDIQVVEFQQPHDRTFKFTWHQVTANDFVDILAYRTYGDSTLWWIIARANPEITDWMGLNVNNIGQLLRIPVLGSVL